MAAASYVFSAKSQCIHPERKDPYLCGALGNPGVDPAEVEIARATEGSCHRRLEGWAIRRFQDISEWFGRVCRVLSRVLLHFGWEECPRCFAGLRSSSLRVFSEVTVHPSRAEGPIFMWCAQFGDLQQAVSIEWCYCSGGDCPRNGAASFPQDDQARFSIAAESLLETPQVCAAAAFISSAKSQCIHPERKDPYLCRLLCLRPGTELFEAATAQEMADMGSGRPISGMAWCASVHLG